MALDHSSEFCLQFLKHVYVYMGNWPHILATLQAMYISGFSGTLNQATHDRKNELGMHRNAQTSPQTHVIFPQDDSKIPKNWPLIMTVGVQISLPQTDHKVTANPCSRAC